MSLRLKQISKNGRFSYLVWDDLEKVGALIDPTLETWEDWREFVTPLAVKVQYAIDTHLHSSHFSATHRAKLEWASLVVMSVKSRSERPLRRVSGGEHLQLGSFLIKFYETPGHSEDSLSLQVGPLIFSGDLWSVSGPGHAETPETLWKSLEILSSVASPHSVLLSSIDSTPSLFSTSENLKRWIETHSQTAWVREQMETLVRVTSEPMKRRLAWNQFECPPDFPMEPPGEAPHPVLPQCLGITVEKFLPKTQVMSSSIGLIDVREPDEYLEAHMPGLANIPMSEICLKLKDLRNFQRIYVSCQSGRRSGRIAQTLTEAGFPDVVNVGGGILAWKNAGYPVMKS